MPLFRGDGGARSFDRKAAGYVATLRQEPSAEDVAWLAGAATRGDEDHAAWELRYGRRALGVLVAQRDALDDRTGSVVARLTTEGFAADPSVDRRMVDVAVAQFNARLSAYRDILQARTPVPLGPRLGQMLLAFAGGPIGRDQAAAERAGDILVGYLRTAAAALQEAFGSPSLPEDRPPSAALG